MIIEALMQLVFNLFALLTLPISIPSLPEEVSVVIESFLEYLQTGILLFAAYFDIGYLMLLFGIVVAVDVGVLLYKFVMWILRKIPMLGMS